MNGTTLEPHNRTEVRIMDLTRTDTIIEIVRVCVMIVIFLTGLIGNGLVIFVTGYKMKTTVNSIWFLNLAITDFIFISILVCNIVEVIFNLVYYQSSQYTFICYFIFMINMFASAFFLTVISLDRCLCTWAAVWAQNKRTLVKARIICVFVWLLAICCFIIPFFIVIFGQYRSFEHHINSVIYLHIYFTVVGFLIPFLIITSSYISIGVRVRRLPGGNQIRLFRVIFVILAFFICWGPYHVMWLCFISASGNHWSDNFVEDLYKAQHFLICLVFLNSCLNPFLYVFMCEEYKTKLKTSLLLVFEGAFTEENLYLN